MSDAVAGPEDQPAKSGKKSLILALVLALAGGGGGYYAASTGLLPFGKGAAEKAESGGGSYGSASDESQGEAETQNDPGRVDMYDGVPRSLEGIAYVEVDPITISLSAGQAVQHLRFRAQLEVNADYEDEVAAVLPRVVDVMNSYLRALELDDLTGPLALARLRAQMLRRLQVVTGKGRVRDLLIMEFVLN